MRSKCPVGHGSRFGGFHVLSRFADVYDAAHNPEVFSSAQGVTVPDFGNPMTAIPLEIDPPERQNRWTTGFRLALGLPAFVLADTLLGVGTTAAGGSGTQAGQEAVWARVLS